MYQRIWLLRVVGMLAGRWNIGVCTRVGWAEPTLHKAHVEL